MNGRLSDLETGAFVASLRPAPPREDAASLRARTDGLGQVTGYVVTARGGAIVCEVLDYPTALAWFTRWAKEEA